MLPGSCISVSLGRLIWWEGSLSVKMLELYPRVGTESLGTRSNIATVTSMPGDSEGKLNKHCYGQNPTDASLYSNTRKAKPWLLKHSSRCCHKGVLWMRLKSLVIYLKIWRLHRWV
jgi:hypothetical protein